MKKFVMLVVLAVTILPMLILAVVVSPLGWSDDVADGYENWLAEDVCNCKEEINEQPENN